MFGMERVLLAAAVGLAFEGHMGGWAVISVENPPAFLEAGSTYRLEYTVRQHGVELHSGLKGKVVVTPTGVGSAAVTSVATSPARSAGRYAGSFRVPDAERVTIRVESGFGPPGYSSLTLISVPVVRAGAASPTISAVERGRHLFVAKGCGTCHLNGDVPEYAAMNRQFGDIGPELTGRKLEAAYVRQRLTKPQSLPAIAGTKGRMPDLGLAAPEVDALVALLTSNSTGERAGL